MALENLALACPEGVRGRTPALADERIRVAAPQPRRVARPAAEQVAQRGGGISRDLVAARRALGGGAVLRRDEHHVPFRAAVPEVRRQRRAVLGRGRRRIKDVEGARRELGREVSPREDEHPDTDHVGFGGPRCGATKDSAVDAKCRRGKLGSAKDVHVGGVGGRARGRGVEVCV